MEDINIQISDLESQIASLPVGYISKKMINGNERYYQQWTENGKIKSKYIKNEEVEEFQKKIEFRKSLQSKLSELKSSAAFIETPSIKDAKFNLRIMYGKDLKDFASQTKKFHKRDCFTQIQKYLYSDTLDKVCLVYGLRRTGKTTMLRQCLYEMKEGDFKRSVYIKATVTDTMAALNKDLKQLRELDIKYVFIDEVTLISDFIDSAAILSDIYSAMGMKIVLSGTDSLGFWLAVHEELYDRAVMVHTTYIPFSEHSRLLGINDVDEYIRYGGTLKAGVWNFENKEVNAEDASFRDNESTRIYIDTAICSNIQHSLKCYQDGNHFRNLYDLYEKKELTGAINRIIENESHKFLVQILTDDFKSHDLHLLGRNLRKEREEENRIEIFDNLNEVSVTKNLMEILEIKNKDLQIVQITDDHVEEIKEYLEALDLLDECDLRAIGKKLKFSENKIFTQPGMRFCQAKALVHSILKDEKFDQLSEPVKTFITERLLATVMGHMLEDIVLLDTKRRYGKSKEVFKLYFAAGEFDMVIYDKKKAEIECFEIKHSDEIVEEQAKHLLNEDNIANTEKMYGKVTRRCVLYKGGSGIASNGIEYKNVEEFLKEMKG
ncbi:MAG: AAA family ATPase [Treponema sp.]|nr:AAA family ATPase [Treponema sp.]